MEDERTQPSMAQSSFHSHASAQMQAELQRQQTARNLKMEERMELMSQELTNQRQAIIQAHALAAASTGAASTGGAINMPWGMVPNPGWAREMSLAAANPGGYSTQETPQEEDKNIENLSTGTSSITGYARPTLPDSSEDESGDYMEEVMRTHDHTGHPGKATGKKDNKYEKEKYEIEEKKTGKRLQEEEAQTKKQQKMEDSVEKMQSQMTQLEEGQAQQTAQNLRFEERRDLQWRLMIHMMAQPRGAGASASSSSTAPGAQSADE
jgi:hypothetical protein